MIKETIESNERKLGFGLFPAEKVLFRTFIDATLKSPFPGAVSGIFVHMSLDEIKHSRTIYGTLDLLGDIGGLSDMLFQIGGYAVALVSFFTGSGLNSVLIAGIFKQDNNIETKDDKHIAKKSLVDIKQRSPFVVQVCKFFAGNPDKKKMEERGESLIYQELDIVHFIRKQKMYDIAMRSLFSKTELYLIKHQRDPFVLTRTDSSSESEDFYDWQPTLKELNTLAADGDKKR